MSLLNLEHDPKLIGLPLEPGDDYVCYAPPLDELWRLAEAERENRTAEDWEEVAREEGDRTEITKVFRMAIEQD